jgi:DNA polymerase-3 subunit chi
MSTQVMFYLLNDEKADADTEIDSAMYHACLQASYFYRQNQRVYIYSEDQHHAEQIDEMLWAFDCDSFVPHNLVGEGPIKGAMVEIGYSVPKSQRSVLINLNAKVPNFANQFQYVVDFVPSNAELKQQARERFKTCRQWGLSVDSQKAIDPNKNSQ